MSVGHGIKTESLFAPALTNLHATSFAPTAFSLTIPTLRQNPELHTRFVVSSTRDAYRLKSDRMSPLARHYEGSDYFAHLTRLDNSRATGASRNRALDSVLGAEPTALDILDAGCGLGGFSQRLRDANRITGADINKRCLAAVVERWGYATLYFHLEDKWPIPPASFDLILFGDVLEHLFSTADVLAQAARHCARMAESRWQCRTLAIGGAESGCFSRARYRKTTMNTSGSFRRLRWPVRHR